MCGKKYGGDKKPNLAFDKGHAGFFSYARDEWKKFETEKIGE